MRANPVRFTGMASGMDTDSIVRDMLRPQQYKIDNQKQQRALLQLKQDAWKEMNKTLNNFHRKFTHEMSQIATFNKNITTSSNTNAININNMETVPQGSHSFKIDNLATSTSLSGKIKGNNLDETTTVGDLLGMDSETNEDIRLMMKIDGKDVKVDVKSGDKLSTIAEKMNKELKNDDFTVSYDAKNGRFFVASTKTGEREMIKFGEEPTVPWPPADPPLTPEQEAATIEKGRDLFKKLGLLALEEGDPVHPIEPGDSGPEVQKGKDAVYWYNGTKFTSSSNVIEVNGIKATLKAVTTEGGDITITSARDTEAIYTWVNEFVTEYNKLLEDINGKIGTKPGKDIKPLTADERAAMSESEIKLWEDKLNSSLFYKDEQLTSFADTARNIFGAKHDQLYEGKERDGTKKYGEELVYKTLSSVGINTGAWQERGKLHIDEDKLKAAIEANSDDVMALFKTVGLELYEQHNATLVRGNDLKSSMNFYNDKVMVDQAKEHEKQILTLEERMYAMEKMHYAKFAAMESMLSALNNQSSWLSQQFGG